MFYSNKKIICAVIILVLILCVGFMLWIRNDGAHSKPQRVESNATNNSRLSVNNGVQGSMNTNTTNNIEIKQYVKGQEFVAISGPLTPKKYNAYDLSSTQDLDFSEQEIWGRLLDVFAMQDVKQIRLTYSCDLAGFSASACPTVNLQSSSDLSSWTTLMSTNELKPGTRWYDFDLTKVRSAKYYRFLILSTHCGDMGCSTIESGGDAGVEIKVIFQ